MVDQKEHKILGEIAHQLEPYYEHKLSIYQTVLSYLTFSHHSHHSTVDTSNYNHKPVTDYTERQILNRSIFALKKIHAVNHHFFPAEEARLLRPAEPGIIPRAI